MAASSRYYGVWLCPIVGDSASALINSNVLILEDTMLVVFLPLSKFERCSWFIKHKGHSSDLSRTLLLLTRMKGNVVWMFSLNWRLFCLITRHQHSKSVAVVSWLSYFILAFGHVVSSALNSVEECHWPAIWLSHITSYPPCCISLIFNVTNCIF